MRKSKTIILFILVELSILIIGGILSIFIIDTKKQITDLQNIVKNYSCTNSSSQDETDEEGYCNCYGNLNIEENDYIHIINPKPNDIVTSPLNITGEARGTWFFEGDFPLSLYDKDCTELVRSYASTQELWMTEDFISFEGTIDFDPGVSSTGFLVLENANTSGCSVYEKKLVIPVRFK
jgi:hypothetical protein